MLDASGARLKSIQQNSEFRLFPSRSLHFIATVRRDGKSDATLKLIKQPRLDFAVSLPEAECPAFQSLLHSALGALF